MVLRLVQTISLMHIFLAWLMVGHTGVSLKSEQERPFLGAHALESSDFAFFHSSCTVGKKSHRPRKLAFLQGHRTQHSSPKAVLCWPTLLRLGCIAAVAPEAKAQVEGYTELGQSTEMHIRGPHMRQARLQVGQKVWFQAQDVQPELPCFIVAHWRTDHCGRV